MSARPERMFLQKSWQAAAPGKSAPSPTIAIPSSCVRAVMSGFSFPSADEVPRGVTERGLRDVEPDAAELLGAGEDGRPFQEVEGHLHDGAMAQLCEERTAHPSVERPHRRAAPDLVVELALRHPGDGPVAPEAHVPAEDQRHLVLRVPLGAFNLGGAAGFEVAARLGPDLGERPLEYLALDAGDGVGRDV